MQQTARSVGRKMQKQVSLRFSHSESWKYEALNIHGLYNVSPKAINCTSRKTVGAPLFFFYNVGSHFHSRQDFELNPIFLQYLNTKQWWSECIIDIVWLGRGRGHFCNDFAKKNVVKQMDRLKGKRWHLVSHELQENNTCMSAFATFVIWAKFTHMPVETF